SSLDETKDTLAEPKHVRHGRTATAQKHNHVLADGELRRGDDDAAEASERTAWHTKLNGLAETALQVGISFERDNCLNAAETVEPLAIDGGHTAARNRHGFLGKLSQIGWDKDGCAHN